MRVRLTQLDGKLPNLALMRLASWHRAHGDEVVFTRRAGRDLMEGGYDRVYGSAIFTMSAPAVARFIADWPGAILGGTGTTSPAQVEDITGPWEDCDYDLYPDFAPSIGFTARGCRLKCKFCVVPGKEGKPRSVNSIADIWRGGNHFKQIQLLDNDFFGQPDWRQRMDEIRDGMFEVCFNQGINVRLVDDEVAEALASLVKRSKTGSILSTLYRDDQFAKPRLYTAWDNLKDEGVFFRGVERLERAGVPPQHLMAYMLCGYAPDETMERVRYRFDRMVERGIMPYPMVYDPARKDLKAFQRWVITGIYRAGITFEEYRVSARRQIDNGQIGMTI